MVALGGVRETMTPSWVPFTKVVPTAEQLDAVGQLTVDKDAKPVPLTPGTSAGAEGCPLLMPMTAPLYPSLTGAAPTPTHVVTEVQSRPNP